MICIEKIIDSKVLIIDKMGVIHALGRVNNSKYHVKLLLDYLKGNYPSLDITKLKIGSSRNYYGYIFGRLGNIIYFNDVNINGTGMFYFPDNLTEKQINTLNNLDLGNIKVAICYSPYKVKNGIEYRMIGLDGEHSLKEAIDEFMYKESRIRRR